MSANKAKKVLNTSSIKGLLYDKSQVTCCYYDQLSIVEAVNKTGKTYQTIKRWYDKLKKEESLFKNREGSGRKTRISKKIEASIKKYVTLDPAITYIQLVRRVKGIKKVSKSCIARYMKRIGKKYYPRKQIILKEEHKKNRLAYAKRIKKTSHANIVFSDRLKFFEIVKGVPDFFSLLFFFSF